MINSRVIFFLLLLSSPLGDTFRIRFGKSFHGNVSHSTSQSGSMRLREDGGPEVHSNSGSTRLGEHDVPEAHSNSGQISEDIISPRDNVGNKSREQHSADRVDNVSDDRQPITDRVFSEGKGSSQRNADNHSETPPGLQLNESVWQQVHEGGGKDDLLQPLVCVSVPTYDGRDHLKDWIVKHFEAQDYGRKRLYVYRNAKNATNDPALAWWEQKASENPNLWFKNSYKPYYPQSGECHNKQLLTLGEKRSVIFAQMAEDFCDFMVNMDDDDFYAKDYMLKVVQRFENLGVHQTFLSRFPVLQLDDTLNKDSNLSSMAARQETNMENLKDAHQAPGKSWALFDQKSSSAGWGWQHAFRMEKLLEFVDDKKEGVRKNLFAHVTYAEDHNLVGSLQDWETGSLQDWTGGEWRHSCVKAVGETEKEDVALALHVDVGKSTFQQAGNAWHLGTNAEQPQSLGEGVTWFSTTFGGRGHDVFCTAYPIQPVRDALCEHDLSSSRTSE